MPRFYIYRRGYNGANNPCAGGGPETVKVATVEAVTHAEAVELALQRVSCYVNQAIWAELAEQIDAREAAIDAAVQVE